MSYVNSKKNAVAAPLQKQETNQCRKKEILAYMKKISIKDDSDEKNEKNDGYDKRAKISNFDDGYFEEFYPVDQLKLAKEKHLPGLRAFSRYFTYIGESAEWFWKPCLVVDYDKDKKQFLLQWDGSTSKKYVSRLNIRFEDESKDLFYERIESAIALRDSMEESLKMHKTISNVKIPPFRPLSKKTKLAIISKIGISITNHQLPVVVRNLGYFNFRLHVSRKLRMTIIIA